MEWKPTKMHNIPLYKQIANHLELRIMNGEFPPGSRLPSERDLANQLHVNRSTINSAFEELRSIGLVERMVGFGTIVSKDVWRNDEKRVPNWDLYVKEGFYEQNNPLNQQIYQFIQSDENIINFAIGELSADLLPSKLLKDIQDSIEWSTNLGYEHVQGNIDLRRTICHHLKLHRQIIATPSSLLITSGAQQAIHLIIRCLLKPGDSIAIEDPSYAYSLPIFRSNGLHTYFLPIGDEGIDPEQIVDLHKKHRLKMLFLNPIFQNPTGTTLSLERRKRVMEICAKFGIPIVEDDPYSTIGYNETSVFSLKSMDIEGTVLYISSLSKIIASGLRIGWILGPQNVISRLADAKQQIDFGHPTLPQNIATKLLNSKHFNNHLKQLRKGLLIKRDLTMQALRNELGEKISFVVPEGGIHLWCKLNDDKLDENVLFKESIKKGIVFSPGSTLGSNSRYMRFTYSRVEPHLIEEGINRFAKSIKKLEEFKN